MIDLFIISRVWLFPVLFLSLGLTSESQPRGSKLQTGSQCLECSPQPSFVCPANTLKCILFLMDSIGRFLLFWKNQYAFPLWKIRRCVNTVACSPTSAGSRSWVAAVSLEEQQSHAPREHLSLFFPGCDWVRVPEFCHLVTLWWDPALKES